MTVVQVGGMAEGDIVKKLGVIHGHGVDVGVRGGQGTQISQIVACRNLSGIAVQRNISSSSTDEFQKLHCRFYLAYDLYKIERID